MAQDCDQPDYVKLVQALCTEANVNLITVPASKTIGEWCGLCKLDAEGLARKVVGCSFVVIKVCGLGSLCCAPLMLACRTTERRPRRSASSSSTSRPASERGTGSLCNARPTVLSLSGSYAAHERCL